MFKRIGKTVLCYSLSITTALLLVALPVLAQTPKLYHGEYPGNRTFNSELDGTNLQAISNSGTGHLDVEVDKANGFVYWSAFNSNQIWRSRLDGSSSVVLHNTTGNPFGIDIDVAGNRVFAGHWSSDNIRCGNLDGSGAFNVLLNAANNVTDVEFDATNSFLYYNVGNGGGNQRGVWRVQIGAGCTTVGAPTRIVNDNGRPYGITLDVPNNLVYWTNAQFARVSRTSLTGAGTITNFCSGGAPAGNWLAGIDLLNGTLYWNGYGSDRTYSSPAAACAVTTLNTSAMNRPWGLAAVEFNPNVSVEKSTNGADSDTPPGNNIVQGNAVTWDYQVSNTGDTVFINSNLVDSDIGAVAVVTAGDTDGDGEIDPGETFNYQANGLAILGQYANTGTYTGTTALNGTDQLQSIDADDSHYFGISPDSTPPTLLSFTSTTANGTYGPGAAISITATYDENLAIGSSLDVLLDNGVTVTLNTLAGATLSGTYNIGATGSGQDSLDLTVNSILSESVDDLFANTQSSSAVPSAPNNLGDSSNIVIDVTAPTLAEVTPVSSPTTNPNPPYTFSSDEAGSINWAGGCDSITAAAIIGNNNVTLDSNGAGGILADGPYGGCNLTVTDAVGNVSAVLNISAFTVDTSPPVLLSFTSTTADNTYGPGAIINITATYNENVNVGSNITVQLDNGVSVLLNSISGTMISGSYTVGATGSLQDSP